MLRRILSIRVLGVFLLLAALAVGGFFWYRSSPLVKIRNVTVTGLSGPQVEQIRQLLIGSAETMTTLNLSMQKLEAAVSAFPQVDSLTATTHGSHSVTINVLEKVPLAELGHNYVDRAGEVLDPSNTVRERLPQLKLRGQTAAYSAAGGLVSGADAMTVLKVLAAAPYGFLPRVASAAYSAANGVVLQLRQGPSLIFGPAARAADKWTAALAVLSNSSAAGAAYINVTDPQAPAAG